MTRQVTLVEVGPRDGFQAISATIPTETKIEVLAGLVQAGLRRIEIGAFVSPRALPQMADIEQILAFAKTCETVESSVLVPNPKGAELAMKAGIENLVYVVSASDGHSRSNVGRSTQEAMEGMRVVLSELKPRGRFRFNLATAFDCPFEGKTPTDSAIRLIEQALRWQNNIEVALCDTTGRATPAEVTSLIKACWARFGDQLALAYHAHDTYGFGIATVLAAYDAGVRIFDAAIAGLGGCPFAPGATGNVASEDVVYAFMRQDAISGVDLDSLISVAQRAASITGANTGGHLRTVVARRREEGVASCIADPRMLLDVKSAA